MEATTFWFVEPFLRNLKRRIFIRCMHKWTTKFCEQHGSYTQMNACVLRYLTRFFRTFAKTRLEPFCIKASIHTRNLYGVRLQLSESSSTSVLIICQFTFIPSVLLSRHATTALWITGFKTSRDTDNDVIVIHSQLLKQNHPLRHSLTQCTMSASFQGGHIELNWTEICWSGFT